MRRADLRAAVPERASRGEPDDVGLVVERRRAAPGSGRPMADRPRRWRGPRPPGPPGPGQPGHRRSSAIGAWPRSRATASSPATRSAGVGPSMRATSMECGGSSPPASTGADRDLGTDGRVGVRAEPRRSRLVERDADRRQGADRRHADRRLRVIEDALEVGPGRPFTEPTQEHSADSRRTPADLVRRPTRSEVTTAGSVPRLPDPARPRAAARPDRRGASATRLAA